MRAMAIIEKEEFHNTINAWLSKDAERGVANESAPETSVQAPVRKLTI